MPAGTLLTKPGVPADTREGPNLMLNHPNTDDTPCEEEDEDAIADWIDQHLRQEATLPQSLRGTHPDAQEASEQPDQ